MVVAVQPDAAVRIGTWMPPDGYALPPLTPTAGTLLAGGGGLDRDHALPGSCRLESTEGEERSAARLRAALGASRSLPHGADPQIFVGARVVLAPELARLLVREVVPWVAEMLVYLGEQLHSLAAALAALRAPGGPALTASPVRLGLARSARGVDPGPSRCRQRREGRYTAGAPRLLAGRWHGREGHLGAGTRHLPALGLLRHRERLGQSRDGAGPLHADTPDLGEGPGAVLQPSTLVICLACAGVVTGPPREAREPRRVLALPTLNAPEERLIGFVESGHHVVPDVAVDGGRLGGRRPCVCA